jgi:hypothetical protein
VTSLFEQVIDKQKPMGYQEKPKNQRIGETKQKESKE